jgi:hypothetical protein
MACHVRIKKGAGALRKFLPAVVGLQTGNGGLFVLRFPSMPSKLGATFLAVTAQIKIRNNRSGFFISMLGYRLGGGLAVAGARLLGIVG